MDSAIEVTVTAHWVNACFLRLAARPVTVVDGAEQETTWAKPTRVAVEPGDHRVAAGVRYRGFSQLLGTEPVDVRVAVGDTLRLRANNGPANAHPFRITNS